MNTFLLILWLATCVALAVFYFLKQRADKAARAAQEQATAATLEGQQVSAQAQAEAQAEIIHARNETEAAVTQARENTQAAVMRAREETQAAVNAAQQVLEQKLAEVASESERLRKHYESEALRIYQEAAQQLEAMQAELAPLRGYANLQDAETEVRQTLAEAITEATALRREAETLLDQTKGEAAQTRLAAQQRARDVRQQADTILNQATRDASRMVEAAERKAEQIGGEAYTALRDKEVIEQALAAIWNTVEGYGDRYVIPTRSVLDELATDFSHTQPGQELLAARDQSRRLVELKLAGTSKYEEADRRDRANRFVVDAFNGRVDAILSRTKHDNYGTLQQEVKDAFSMVNSNGLVFHEARILPAYLDARLAELKWAAVVQELKRKEREEQRELQERIREEEKASREYQRALQEAAREEEIIRRAMQKARAEAENASVAERARLEGQLADLNDKLLEAEAKSQRALSMAQQTKAGNVYIISNVGSFGDDVYKIGMTRRLVPEDRIRELGSASVPFEFDVHAMIKSNDAPALEHLLHATFADARINKVNGRKEFFRLPLERLRQFVGDQQLDATFTMAADAREYRETLALERMEPAERQKYQVPDLAEEEEATTADTAVEAEP